MQATPQLATHLARWRLLRRQQQPRSCRRRQRGRCLWIVRCCRCRGRSQCSGPMGLFGHSLVLLEILQRAPPCSRLLRDYRAGAYCVLQARKSQLLYAHDLPLGSAHGSACHLVGHAHAGNYATDPFLRCRGVAAGMEHSFHLRPKHRHRVRTTCVHMLLRLSSAQRHGMSRAAQLLVRHAARASAVIQRKP